jgi:hypothetical protein
MSHPDKWAVGPLGLGLAALGLLLDLVVLVLVCRNAYRVLPLRRSRPTYWIGMAVLVPAFLAAALLTPMVVGRVAVIASFGWEADAEGLRVVNKHGQLSDGRFLGVFWAAAFGAGWFPIWGLLTIPVVAWYTHFNPGRRLACGVAPAGVVRLDGQPIPNARVTFHVEAGRAHRAYAAVDADESGRYEFRWLPLRYRVTVAADGVHIPPWYVEPGQTPLEFAWDQLGSVAQDLELSSSPLDETPPQTGGAEPGGEPGRAA